jgi:hypothetical protein
MISLSSGRHHPLSFALLLIHKVFVYDLDPWVVDEIYILAFGSRRKSFGKRLSTLRSRNKSYLYIGMSLLGANLLCIRGKREGGGGGGDDAGREGEEKPWRKRGGGGALAQSFQHIFAQQVSKPCVLINCRPTEKKADISQQWKRIRSRLRYFGL